MYDRRVDGRTLTLGVSGKLIMNDLVMYDRETGSLWPQFLGQAIEGPLLGKKLTAIPAVHTTWAAWRHEHPHTLVLDKGGGYRSDRYQSYYLSGSAGAVGVTNPDDRLPAKELVLGVVRGGKPKAYPFSVLAQEPVVNDTVGGEEVVVVFDPKADTALIFERTLDGRKLTFEAAELGESPPVLRDRETGSLWSGLSGKALSGSLAGQALRPIPATYAFWFGWHDFFTNTEVYAVPPKAGSQQRGSGGRLVSGRRRGGCAGERLRSLALAGPRPGRPP